MSESMPPSSERLRIAKSQFQGEFGSLQMELSKDVRMGLKDVKFPEISILSVEETAAEVEKALEKLVEIRSIPDDAQNRRRTAKDIVRKWYRASYPFMQIFLEVGVAGSAVIPLFLRANELQLPVLNPYGLLCGGLLILNRVRIQVRLLNLFR